MKKFVILVLTACFVVFILASPSTSGRLAGQLILPERTSDPTVTQNTVKIRNVSNDLKVIDEDGNTLTLSPTSGISTVGSGVTINNGDLYVRGFIDIENGDDNVFIGQESATGVQSTANDNTSLGRQALRDLTTGDKNTAIGSSAMGGTAGANNNVAVGWAALSDTANTADGNTALGYRAMMDNEDGYQNTGVGEDALTDNTTGYRNTAVGSLAGDGITTGYYHTAIGFNALGGVTDALSNVAIGGNALGDPSCTGSYNVAIGHDSLFRNSGGYENVAVGEETMRFNTSGYRNVALGRLALDANTAGYNNIGIGYQAGDAITTGSRNILIGIDSDVQSNGDDNSIIIGDNTTGLGTNSIVIGSTSAVTTVLRGNVGIDTTDDFLSSATAQVSIPSGVSPTGTLTDAASFYVNDGDMYVASSKGDHTQLSPHNDNGEWEFFSRNTKTGRIIKINMEAVIREVERLSGKKFIEESWEEQ